MEKGVISVNVKKIKANTSVNALVSENYREEENAEHYDNGRRVMDTEKTVENVFLLERPENYDSKRRERIKRVNAERAERVNYVNSLKGARDWLRESGELQATMSREAAKTRKLRSDTVDTLGLVVQPSAEFINSLDREQQIQFFRDSLTVMQGHPDWFGKIETAVIHFDENTPHMQCLASTINEDTLTSDAKAIVGNKSKMSNRQTLLASGMKAEGWDVERGMRRVNNPDYQNFKSDMDALGIKVNRHNDAVLKEQWDLLKAERASLELMRDSISFGEKELSRGQEENRRYMERMDEKKAELEGMRKNALAEQAKAYDATRGLEKAKAAIKVRYDSLDIREKRLDARARELDSREKGLNIRAGELDSREKGLDAREGHISAQQSALAHKDRELVDKEKKSLKIQNTASESIERLNRMVSNVRRMTESQRKQVNKLLEKHVPVTEENLEDLNKALDSLQSNMDGLSL